jgi:hypothetical protein
MAASFHTNNMIFLMVVSTEIGVAAAVYLHPADWGVVRTILLGALGGAGCGFLIIASRALGAFEAPEDPKP